MSLKVTGKISLDCNTRYSFVHRIHDYCYCSYYCSPCIWLLLLLLSPYRLNILGNMDIDWFNWIE